MAYVDAAGNCSDCGDRLGAAPHRCWVREKFEGQEYFLESGERLERPAPDPGVGHIHH